MRWIAVLFILILLFVLLRPVRRLTLAAVRSAGAFFGILAFNHLAAPFGIAMGANLINAGMIGVFGLPGIASALLLNIII